VLLLRAIASGSSGNAFLLKTGHVSLLFDAGIPIKRLASALRADGVSPQSLTAVFISHEHRDHCLAAGDLADFYDIPIWANSEALRAAGLHERPQAAVFESAASYHFGDVEVSTFPVAHDAAAPVGFLIKTDGRTITLATDLGTVTEDVSSAIRISDLVVLEANHDLEMLHSGRYPYHLRRRVSSSTGHLSNDQAADALCNAVAGEDVEVWLAHLSRENNSPMLATSTVRRALHGVGLNGVSLRVARRDKPSLSWNGAARPRQLSLFGSQS
jgi:phosphoribosyl 1,2-cyclic phosphodiesterase